MMMGLGIGITLYATMLCLLLVCINNYNELSP